MALKINEGEAGYCGIFNCLA